MVNEILFFVTTVVCFSLVVLSFRLFGRAGILAWMGVATVIANIEVVKCVDIFGLAVTLGNVIYGSTFLCTDILSQLYGKKEAHKGVWMGFSFMLFTTLLLQMSLRFQPNGSDFASGAMETVFNLLPRISISSLGSFLVSNTLDVILFSWIGKHTKRVWLKNNLATMTAQLVDSFLFTFCAFGGTFEPHVLVELAATTYVMKLIVAVMDTPFLYMAIHIRKTGKYSIIGGRDGRD